MDYLKSFTIGTSGLITLQHFLPLALQSVDNKDVSSSVIFPFKEYSIVAPIYYGVMSMLALYIGKTCGLSLALRLFITSIISIVFVTLLNYNVSRKKYEPYKSYTTKEWLYYIIRNGSRHIIAFNLIMFYFEKYFTIFTLKAFIIGSSAFSYLITYLKVAWLDSQQKTNYDYKFFTVYEPIGHGLLLIFAAVIFKNFFHISLRKSMFINSLLLPCGWFLTVRYLLPWIGRNTYNYDKQELFIAFLRVLVTSLIKYNVVLYLLLTHLRS